MKKFITKSQLEKLIIEIVSLEHYPIPRNILLKKTIRNNVSNCFISVSMFNETINEMNSEVEKYKSNCNVNNTNLKLLNKRGNYLLEIRKGG